MQPASLDLALAAQGFAAVGSAARLQVLNSLVRAGHAGLNIGEIQQRLQIPLSTLAHHLKYLSDADLIEQQKQGRSVLNRARYDQIEALASFLLNECCADACTTVETGHER